MKIKLLGCDPSMSNLGLAVASVDIDTLEIQIENLLLVETVAGATKTVRKNSDDMKRCQRLMIGFLRQVKDVSMVVAEVPHGSQSARAMASYGMCVMMLAACPKPVIEVSEREVKEAMTGIRTATKDEMIKEAMRLHPNANWLLTKRKGVMVPVDKNEHLADAVGALMAGIQTDQFKQAVAMHRALLSA